MIFPWLQVRSPSQSVESDLLTLTTVLLFIISYSWYEVVLGLQNGNWDQTRFFTCHFFLESLLCARHCVRDVRLKKRCSVYLYGVLKYSRKRQIVTKQQWLIDILCIHIPLICRVPGVLSLLQVSKGGFTEIEMS